MEREFTTAFGTFGINRDTDEDKTLRGWDTSDSYALDYFASNFKDLAENENLNITIFNDSFGAVGCALSKFNLESISDSFTTHMVFKANLKLNGLDTNKVSLVPSNANLEKTPDIIFFKVPKSNNYLEYLLQKIASSYPSGIPLIGFGMSKNIHSSTVSLFEHYLEEVHTSLARKKARLIHGKTQGNVENLNTYPVKYTLSDYGKEIINQPNVFSFGKLDGGTRYLIDHFPRFKNQPEKVIDLGCGDGTLALMAAEKWPDTPITCVDDSCLAVETARENFKINGFEGRSDFIVTDCLSGIADESADLILCNPPFHEEHSVSMGTAGRMFEDSLRVLKPGGSLFVVKNRHLGYQKALERLMGECKTIAGNKKYEVLKAVKRV